MPVVKYTLCKKMQLAKFLYSCSAFVMLGYLAVTDSAKTFINIKALFRHTKSILSAWRKASPARKKIQRL